MQMHVDLGKVCRKGSCLRMCMEGRKELTWKERGKRQRERAEMDIDETRHTQRQDRTEQSKARRDKTRQDKTRQDKTRQDKREERGSERTETRANEQRLSKARSKQDQMSFVFPFCSFPRSMFCDVILHPFIFLPYIYHTTYLPVLYI